MLEIFNEISDFLNTPSNFVYVFRICLAAVCGGIIGVERTLRQKDAGFRTHIIVAFGAAVMMIVSKYGFFDVVIYDSIQLDASRVSSNIITGISFLGAGMIFVKGFSIKGLTTAAGIWSTAAVGMAIGSGLYVVGVVTVIMLLLVQIIFHKFLIGFDKVLANDNFIPCFLQIDNTPDCVKAMKNYFNSNKIYISDSVVTEENNILTIHINIQCGNEVDLESVMDRYLELDGVHQAFTL